MNQKFIDLIKKLSDLTNHLLVVEAQHVETVSPDENIKRAVVKENYFKLRDSLYDDLYRILQKCKAIRYDRIAKIEDSMITVLYINFFNKRCPIFAKPFELKFFENENVVNHLLNNSENVSISEEFQEVLSILAKYEKNPEAMLDLFVEKLRERDINQTQDKIISAETLRDKYIQDLETIESHHDYTKPIKNNVFNRLFHRQQLKYQNAQTELRQSIADSESELTILNTKLSDLQEPSKDTLSTYRAEAINIFNNVKSANEFAVSVMEILDIMNKFKTDNKINTFDINSIDVLLSPATRKRHKINYIKNMIFNIFNECELDKLIESLNTATPELVTDKVYENIPRILELITEYNNLENNDLEN